MIQGTTGGATGDTETAGRVSDSEPWSVIVWLEAANEV